MPEIQGENLIALFQESAQRMTTQISRIDNVIGIVQFGALVRGFADCFSDVDVTTFVTSDAERVRGTVREIGKTEQLRFGLEVDLEVHELDQFRREKWNEIRRWDFRNSGVVYDPKGVVREMLVEKLNVSSTFWLRRIVLSCVYTTWYCCPAEPGQPTLLDVAVSRGDLLSAHYYVNYGIELLLQALFAMNREFLPPPKWRVFYSCKLNWLPTHFRECIASIVVVKQLSASELDRRVTHLRQLWSETWTRLNESMGLTPKKATDYYVDRILKQRT